MLRFIANFDRATVEARIASGPCRPLAEVRLDTPVAWPNKVIAYPANYHAHIEEMKDGLVSTFKTGGQGFFLKANSSLSGPADPIVLPAVVGREVHHECELAIVIGKGGRDIGRADALDHIFGYACLVDVVIRGREERVMRKSFDSFCPVGPWITTADEIADPANIALELHINGALRQSANTRDLIVDIPEMIAMASSVMTLFPGDIIATGTPAGVAPITDGDVLDIAIAGVGAMRLAIVRGTAGAHPVWDKPAS
ncbi:fumarylacetoacetate hydrolase family protein [Sphingomonas sp. TF3]|uniref:fumarylacetoacetate hydrolase family protein n=1 Tax=Sphingomonas sp. TF3 TaxID=2495580 RepID=UPI001C8D0946|nr:fumarylacetoacetate hydrolase family protein [Sphingomonas sp. TF3]